MRVTGIDVETTGLNANEDHVIEIAAVTFDGLSWEPISQMSTFVRIIEMAEVPESITKLTGITTEMMQSGKSPMDAFMQLDSFCQSSDLLVAHNKAFDQEFIAKNAMNKRIPLTKEFSSKMWLCSMADIKTHNRSKCWRLSHLAIDYGIPVDPSLLHRALDDVLLMGKMLKATGMTAAEMRTWMLEPSVTLSAEVQEPWKDGGKGVDLAKKDGYKFDPEKKKWLKKVKQSELEAERARFPGFGRLTVNEK